MLYTKTVEPSLWNLLQHLSALPELKNFCLVGGTALALHLGHRKSEDLDFFTNGYFDIQELKLAITDRFANLEILKDKPHGISFLFSLKDLPGRQRKVDIYNWSVKFLRPFVVEEGIRLASLEDIAAFKLDSICGRKEQKDYFDLALLTGNFSFAEMMTFYQEKFPYKDKRTVLTEILKTKEIEDSDTPEMLIDMSLEKAIKKIESSLQIYTEELVQKNIDLQKEIEKKREELVQQKRQKNKDK